MKNIFKPSFTPTQMLSLGVFDGNYFGRDPTKLPYFKNQTHRRLVSDFKTVDPSLNAFGVHSGLSLEQWMKAGWIHPEDPFGWFEWYCKYHKGRRMDDDERQIRRWAAYSRHSQQVLKCNGVIGLRPVQRQSLLHWARDPFPDVDTKLYGSVFRKTKKLLAVLNTQT